MELRLLLPLTTALTEIAITTVVQHTRWLLMHPPFSKQVVGRDAIAAYIANVTQRATNWSFTDFIFSATPDPDTFFVEFEDSALATATGKTYCQVYILIGGSDLAPFISGWWDNRILSPSLVE